MQSRRDFLGNLSKWAAGYSLSNFGTERAAKAIDVLHDISALDKHCMLNSLHAMDELIGEMAGKGSVANYRKLIKDTAKLLKEHPNMGLAELATVTRELRTAMPSIKALNPDILAAYEQYTGGKGIKAVYLDPRMQKITTGYMDAKFMKAEVEGFTGVRAAQEETIKVLTMDPARRAEYLDKQLGVSRMKERATTLIEEIDRRREILEQAQAAEPLKGKCDVWPKVQLKDYGYNIKVRRKQVSKNGFKVDETYSEWERRTAALAETITNKFPDAFIGHERFQQGRIVVLVEKGGMADEYFRDFHKEPERKTPEKKTGAISFGLGR